MSLTPYFNAYPGGYVWLMAGGEILAKLGCPSMVTLDLELPHEGFDLDGRPDGLLCVARIGRGKVQTHRGKLPVYALGILHRFDDGPHLMMPDDSGALPIKRLAGLITGAALWAPGLPNRPLITRPEGFTIMALWQALEAMAPVEGVPA